MSIFDLFSGPDINEGLEQYDVIPNALLLDVRTPQEYDAGHIPGSENIPLQSIDQVRSVAANKSTPLFVYCRSGARSRQAAGLLQRMGYMHVKNLGGIAAYRGRMEYGA